MSTKRQEMELANRGQGCLGKAADDEPVFVLRAQDRFAPDLIESWAARVDMAWSNHLSGSGVEPVDRARAKVKEARALAHTMRAWQALHNSKTPD